VPAKPARIFGLLKPPFEAAADTRRQSGKSAGSGIACGAIERDNEEVRALPGTHMTFAVIKTGGKQYKVAANDVVKIEKIAGEPGDVVTFDQVLMVGEGDAVTVGAPLVEGALVAAQFIATEKERTVIILKKERRQHYDRRNGHRQRLSTVRITEILTGGAKPTTKVDEIAKARHEKRLAAAAAAEAAIAAKAQGNKKPEAPAAAEAPAEKAPAKKAAPKKAAAKKAETTEVAAEKPAKKPAAKKAAKAADKE
jgi:large subunit ribosomal protein L21